MEITMIIISSLDKDFILLLSWAKCAFLHLNKYMRVKIIYVSK